MHVNTVGGNDAIGDGLAAETALKTLGAEFHDGRGKHDPCRSRHLLGFGEPRAGLQRKGHLALRVGQLDPGTIAVIEANEI